MRYELWWHDGGMTVRRLKDGKTASFRSRRDVAEVNAMTEAEMFRTLNPVPGHRNFQ